MTSCLVILCVTLSHTSSGFYGRAVLWGATVMNTVPLDWCILSNSLGTTGGDGNVYTKPKNFQSRDWVSVPRLFCLSRAKRILELPWSLMSVCLGLHDSVSFLSRLYDPGEIEHLSSCSPTFGDELAVAWHICCPKVRVSPSFGLSLDVTWFTLLAEVGYYCVVITQQSYCNFAHEVFPLWNR